ncbi:peptidoglycan-binding protein [Bacillus safensis]|uniref:peptidoglycan-binding protein n=1 Tax=Bacillus safensis TaxID=561879 RepID=UPI0035C694BC
MMGGMTLSQLQAGKRPVLVSLLSNKVSAKPIKTTPVKSSPAKSTTKLKTPSKKTYNLPAGIIKVTKPLTKGVGVKSLQEALSALFFYPEKGAKNNGIDGYYGPKTADAVKRFQLMNGLAADGIYGPKTKAALEKLLK